MPDNRAILIGNAVSYGSAAKDVPSSVVRSFIADFVDRLENLGESSFRVTSIINRTRLEARDMIDRAIHQARSSDLLLIYYFGHGVKSPQGELFFYFKDSDFLDLASMLAFKTNILTPLVYNRIRKVLIVLDCCYAGIVRHSINDPGDYTGQLYLMASVTHKSKAKIDYGDDRPIGIFSKHVLTSFTDPAARQAYTRTVTPESMFSYAQRKTKENSKQEPFRIDRGLGQERLFEQETTVSIPQALRESVPLKSVYHKIYRLCTLMVSGRFRNSKTFYAFVVRRRPKEFLTPFKVGPETTEYHIMGEAAFNRYLGLCRLLGIVEEMSPPRLSALGKKMIRPDGRKFNSLLYETLTQNWKTLFGIEIQDIEDIVGKRMSSYGIATVDGVYREMYLTKKIIMPRPLFKALLDLTAYVGVLRYSREPTYFLTTWNHGG